MSARSGNWNTELDPFSLNRFSNPGASKDPTEKCLEHSKEQYAEILTLIEHPKPCQKDKNPVDPNLRWDERYLRSHIAAKEIEDQPDTITLSLKNSISNNSDSIEGMDTKVKVLAECSASISRMRDYRRKLVISMLKGTPVEQSIAAYKLDLVNGSIDKLNEYENILTKSISKDDRRTKREIR